MYLSKKRGKRRGEGRKKDGELVLVRVFRVRDNVGVKIGEEG